MEVGGETMPALLRAHGCVLARIIRRFSTQGPHHHRRLLSPTGTAAEAAHPQGSSQGAQQIPRKTQASLWESGALLLPDAFLRTADKEASKQPVMMVLAILAVFAILSHDDDDDQDGDQDGDVEDDDEDDDDDDDDNDDADWHGSLPMYGIVPTMTLSMC